MGAIEIDTFSFESLKKNREKIKKKLFFLDFVTRMKLLSLWPNLAWKLAYKGVMNQFSKDRKGTS